MPNPLQLLWIVFGWVQSLYEEGGALAVIAGIPGLVIGYEVANALTPDWFPLEESVGGIQAMIANAGIQLVSLGIIVAGFFAVGWVAALPIGAWKDNRERSTRALARPVPPSPPLDISRSPYASELLAALPQNEFSTDEKLTFSFTETGHLSITTSSAFYVWRDGTAKRFRNVDGGQQITTWRDKRLLSTIVVPSTAGPALIEPKLLN